MSKLVANAAYRVVSRLPFKTVRKLAGKKLILPVYHLVSDEEVPHIKHLFRYRSVKEFRADLDFFLRHYTPIGLSDLLANLRNGTAIPKNSFHLSFDDGLRELYDIVAPILEAKGVPATFFLTTGFLDNKTLGYAYERGLLLYALRSKPERAEQIAAALRQRGIQCRNATEGIKRVRYDQQEVLDELAELLDVDFAEYLASSKPYLDAAQVEELLRRGFTIGAHSIDHPLYALLSLQEQLRQTAESVRFIRERFRLDYNVFAFPHSDMGVSRTFFDEVFGRGILDASFGISGLVEDVHPRNIQRLWMEYGSLSAQQRVYAESVDFCLMKLTGREMVQRWG